MPKTYTTACVDCGVEMDTPRKPPAAGLCCGFGPCLDAHNARVIAAQVEAKERRRARAAQRRANPPAPQPLYGDLRWVAAFNGIATDGTGRKRG